MDGHYALWVAYDGSAYAGWQRQQNAVTVQGVVEKTLAHIVKAPVTLHASGRTDAGVHALAQCASFTAPALMPADKLRFALNNRLPEDIYVTALEEVPADFHARYSAVGKTYAYKLYVSEARNPFYKAHYAQVKKPLDEVAVRQAMTAFLGTHDFKGFMASGSHVKTTVRTVHAFTLEVSEGLWTFEITGDGFLYNMVRIIIGLLLRVGHGHIDSAAVPEIIASGDRSRARWTAPPNGLYLVSVSYPQKND
ncbi:tRNA pseudouridine(38-40) synthase TruA [Fusibacter sp. JL298sf-3]